MPLIQIRDVPDHVYRLLAERAEKEHRSLAQQAMAVLAQGLDVELDAKARRRKVLRAIQTAVRTQTDTLRDPAKLVRKDRRR